MLFTEGLIFCSIFLVGLSETYEDDSTFQPTQLTKMKKDDLTLRCLLLDKHEKFNQNVNVTWLFKKTCKVSCWNQAEREEDWVEVDCGGPCKLALTLNDETASKGLYLCKINPYQISETTSLNVEVTKTFQLDIMDPWMTPPPELFDNTPTQFSVRLHSQVVLQCKCRSSQKPTIKWFKRKDENYLNNNPQTSYKSFIENARSIKYFENFYEPVMSGGLRELSDNIYLSKLIVNNITQNSIYACVAINYFGFSHREHFIVLSDLEVSDESIFEFSEKNYEILILIPLLLLVPISALCFTVLYLFINRQILQQRNKKIDQV